MRGVRAMSDNKMGVEKIEIAKIQEYIDDGLKDQKFV